MIIRRGRRKHARREQRNVAPARTGERASNACGSDSSGKICTEIANQLEVSEHEIFLRAYSWYYGAEPTGVDKAFKRYLMTGCEEIPHYVTHFARNWTNTLLVA